MGNSSNRRWVIISALAATVLLLVAGVKFLSSRSLYKDAVFDGRSMDLLPEPQRSDRILIFAPHEDDELLGTGCYIQRAVQAGAHVRVVMMTNGEYPEASMMLTERTIAIKPEEFIRYGKLRQAETLRALSVFGIFPPNVTFLGYPDHTLDQLLTSSHWLPEDALLSLRTKSISSPYDNSFTKSALHCGQAVLNDVRNIIAAESPNIVIAVHPYDVHIDHWATGAFVRLALSQLKAENPASAAPVRFFNYLVHRPNWPFPKGSKPGDSLIPPIGFAGLSSTSWYAFPASITESLLKHQGLLSYKSQVSGWSPLLLSFVRTNELFGEVPPIQWQIGSGERNIELPAEPIADSDIARNIPGADIKAGRLSYSGGLLTVEIETAEVITPTTTFKIEAISGNGDLSGLEVTNLVLGPKQPTGARIVGTKKSGFSVGQVNSSISGNKAVVSLPWTPAVNGGFLIVWCRSYIAQKNIDQSMISCIEY